MTLAWPPAFAPEQLADSRQETAELKASVAASQKATDLGVAALASRTAALEQAQEQQDAAQQGGWVATMRRVWGDATTYKPPSGTFKVGTDLLLRTLLACVCGL